MEYFGTYTAVVINPSFRTRPLTAKIEPTGWLRQRALFITGPYFYLRVGKFGHR